MMSSFGNKVWFFSKRTIILFVVLSASAVWVLVYNLPEESLLEDKVYNDLKLISDGESPAGFINSYDLICFTLNTETPTYEIRVDFKPKTPRFSQECRASLLSFSSSATIGLVKGDDVQCIKIKKFNYWIEVAKRSCIQPGKLRVVKITSAPQSKGFGQPRQSNLPSSTTFQIPNFQIMEQQ